MNLVTTVNALANGVLATSALHLIFRVFGHSESAVWKRPWAAVLCKAATTLTVCGALWNLLTFSTPPYSELLLNIGIALNFLWISFFYDRSTSAKHSRSARKISGRNSSRRAANSRSRKKSSSTSSN
jgi:hypothetical protein